MCTPTDDAVAVVRAYIGPYSGEEFVPVVEAAARVYEAGGISAMARHSPQTAALVELVDPEIEWEMPPVGTYTGQEGLLAFWRDWAALWDSYVYEVRGYERAGPLVLSTANVRARGRDGIRLELTSFQLWEVRDGRIVWQSTFVDRDEALSAAAQRAA